MEHNGTQEPIAATWDFSRSASRVWKGIGWVFFALAAVGLIPLFGFTVVLVTRGRIHPDGWVILSIVLPSMTVLSAIGFACRRVARSQAIEPKTKLTLAGGILAAIYSLGMTVLGICMVLGAEHDLVPFGIFYLLVAVVYFVAVAMFWKGRPNAGSIWLLVAGILNLPVGLFPLVIAIVVRTRWRRANPQ
jgi:hypothetical protein